MTRNEYKLAYRLVRLYGKGSYRTLAYFFEANGLSDRYIGKIWSNRFAYTRKAQNDIGWWTRCHIAQRYKISSPETYANRPERITRHGLHLSTFQGIGY